MLARIPDASCQPRARTRIVAPLPDLRSRSCDAQQARVWASHFSLRSDRERPGTTVWDD